MIQDCPQLKEILRDKPIEGRILADELPLGPVGVLTTRRGAARLVPGPVLARWLEEGCARVAGGFLTVFYCVVCRTRGFRTGFSEQMHIWICEDCASYGLYSAAELSLCQQLYGSREMILYDDGEYHIRSRKGYFLRSGDLSTVQTRGLSDLVDKGQVVMHPGHPDDPEDTTLYTRGKIIRRER